MTDTETMRLLLAIRNSAVIGDPYETDGILSAALYEIARIAHQAIADYEAAHPERGYKGELSLSRYLRG